MDKVTIILSGKSPITQTGGYGAYANTLAKVTSSLGYKNYIFGYAKENAMHNMEHAIFMDFKVPLPNLFSLLLPVISYILSKKISKWLKENKPKEVYFFSLDRWGFIVNILRRTLKNEKIKHTHFNVVFSSIKHSQKGQIEGTSIKDHSILSLIKMYITYLIFVLFFAKIERRVLKKADLIIYQYEFTKRILLENHPLINDSKFIKSKYYSEVYNRISNDKSTFDFKNGIPNLLTICRQDPRKGVNIYIHALKKLKDKGIKFNAQIAGNGIYFKYHEKLIKKLGLSDEVKMLGFVGDITPLLEKSDIYIFPAINEGGSGAISLMEAMNYGLPIVTTTCDGIPEDFIHEKTALLVKQNNSDMMAESIERLISDEELRKILSKNVKIEFPRLFSFEGMKDGIQNAINQIK